MTMDDIAREAGVSKRTIYTYFPSKEEVGLSSIARVVSYAQEQMRAAAAADGPHSGRLKEMLIVRVMARVESVREYRESLDDLFEVVRPAYMERRRESFEKEAAMAADVIREGVAHGEFVSNDAERDAQAMLRATSAYLPYSLTVAELGDTETIHEGLTAVVSLLISGLKRK
jgi:AcrR family transcriptional regulator